MHARTAVRDAKVLFIGSISYSLNSTTFNREVGVCVKERGAVERVRRRFEEDFVGKVSVPLREAL
jgi:phosphatidylserine/phosphatidylglycerophosphate/cardiolipin synthase-like enzyme